MASKDPIAVILGAKTLYARLELPDEAVEVSVVRKHYYKLALLVHPDKNEDPRANAAFQALSAAFERLSSEVGQASYLKEVSKVNHQVNHACSERRERSQEEKDKQARWWDTKTWEEFEHRLKHRERAEAALTKQFFTGQRVRFERRKVRGQVRCAERSVEHCDRNQGLSESELWPPESRQAARDLEAEVLQARLTELYPGQADEALPNYDERAELDDPKVAIVRLLELMTHLRTVHLYCLYCGCKYDSPEDMDRNCPGITEEEHDEAMSAGLRDSAETTIVPAGEAEEPGEDPLEAYMASIDAQLQEDKPARKKRRR
eukprot:TRINITY_DN15239_c0_g2_i1.p1 TRINITY_DN15239_c0_g2~~TRINITY_DN15239_c0_g2_i1.p1  ORF type:complete len:318 (+),score=63.26 TRINITY_DN15239_c0_g2_i1:112-1065(+)